MAIRTQHIVHLLIRKTDGGEQQYFVYPRSGWKSAEGADYLTLPAKRTVQDPLAPFLRGTDLDKFINAIVMDELSLQHDDFVIELELPPVTQEAVSPVHHELTDYVVYPVDVWVKASAMESMTARLYGRWLSCEQGINLPIVSPTTQAVFRMILEHKPAAVSGHADHPTMDGLALKWFHENRDGIRILPKGTLDNILNTGDRAFNLRVADPYLRYQLQGQGFTWSFFTEKDHQDVHVHGAPVVEIYGVLEGQLEIWSKPYYDRGTSAWRHGILNAGDWVEVDALQCHIAHWLAPGKGVVFKAGPGPLTGVGRLGEKGKTPCANCSCMKPPEVLHLERLLGGAR